MATIQKQASILIRLSNGSEVIRALTEKFSDTNGSKEFTIDMGCKSFRWKGSTSASIDEIHDFLKIMSPVYKYAFSVTDIADETRPVIAVNIIFVTDDTELSI